MTTQQSTFYLPSVFVGFVRECLQVLLFDSQTAVNMKRTNGLDLTSWRLVGKTSHNRGRQRYFTVLSTNVTFNNEAEISAPWSLNT